MTKPESENNFINKIDKSEKKEGFTTKQRIIALVAGLALALSLCACDNGDIAAQGRPTTSASANPSENYPTAITSTETETSPESQIDYSMPPEDVVEGFLFETLNNEQQAEIKKMEKMSVEEFRTLPKEDQLKFAYWVYTTNKGRTERILRANSIEALDYKENPVTAEDYANDYNYIMAFVCTLDNAKVNPKSGTRYDMDTAKKLSVLFTTSTENHLSGWDGTIESANESGMVADENVEISDYIISDEKVIFSYIVRSNKTVTVLNGEDRFQFTYEKATFKTIDGKDVSLPVYSLSVSDEDPRYIQNLGQ
ncbi:MAG: hypothetical protein ACYCX2_01400 [Christensenellales bacterium]